MQRFYAPLLLLLSLVLFSLVSVDFLKLKEKSQPPEVTKPKTDLVEKANEIGAVLGDQEGQVLPGDTGGSYYYKFYLKDQTGTAITTGGSTDKALIKGATITVTNKSSFTCGDGGANYTFTEFDGLYKLLCNEAATMNVRISKSGYSTKNTSVAVYQGEIPTIYLARYVAPPPPPPPETIKDVKLPTEFSETGGSTNLGAITDATKVDLTLDTDSNTIKFKETVDLSATDTKDKFKELNKYVKAGQKGVVGVDSSSLPALNKKASITMKALAFLKTPKILVDGKEDKSVVSNISYKDGTLTFDVTKFSTYMAVPIVEISQPENNFETFSKKTTLKGSVSDPSAEVSASLNDKDLGKLEVATDSGKFQKEVELESGTNKLVVSALATNLATASASVSGTLKDLANYAPLYLLLLILAAVAVWGIFKAVQRIRKNKSVVTQSKPTDTSIGKPQE